MGHQSSQIETEQSGMLPYWLMNSARTAAVLAENRHLRAQLQQRKLQTLLVSYRASNNLQLAANLLSEEAHLISDDKALASHARLQTGLTALSMLQRMLIVSDDRNPVDLKGYLELYGEALECAISSGLHDRVVQMDIDEMTCDSATANALGVVANELVLSIFKDVPSDVRSSSLSLSLKRQRHLVVLLAVADFSPPLSSLVDGSSAIEELHNNRLLALLMQQLGGTIARADAGGARIECTFPATILEPQAT